MPKRIWFGVGVGLLALAALGAAYLIIAPRVEPLPILWALPDTLLIDQDGRPLSLSQTRGKVAAVGLIYTYCPDICPLTTARMKTLQDRIQAAGLSDQVRLVTFSIDPERDTPAVLKQYAQVRRVDLSNWVFLTGAPDQVQQLIERLKVYTERVYIVNGTPIPARAMTAPLSSTAAYLVYHTDRVFLVDRRGNVRALVSGSQMDVEDALRLIRQLLDEPSS